MDSLTRGSFKSLFLNVWLMPGRGACRNVCSQLDQSGENEQGAKRGMRERNVAMQTTDHRQPSKAETGGRPAGGGRFARSFPDLRPLQTSCARENFIKEFSVEELFLKMKGQDHVRVD